jgi:phage terminase large subunit
VHKLLSDRIATLGLSKNFIIKQDSIISCTGSEIIFKGLSRQIAEIKSTEGVDWCWIEEAQYVTHDNWEILIPTIRREKSEIIISFNPENESDATYQRFIVNTPPNAYIQKVNYYDNPFFPEVLRQEMEYIKRVDYDAYLNIWEGQPKKLSDSIIFKEKYKVDDFEPYNPENDGRLYGGADWGFSSDPFAALRCFIRGRRLFIDYEAYGVGIEIDALPSAFDRIPDIRKIKILGDWSRPETISYVKRHGFNIDPAPKWPESVEDGIAFLKSFEKIIIHPRCKNTADEFARYAYKIDKNTSEILRDIVDKHNHIIDALRYALSFLIKRNVSIFDVYRNMR